MRSFSALALLSVFALAAPALASPPASLASPPASLDRLPAVEAPYPGLSADGPERSVELQVWWLPSFGHIHATAILPFGGSVKGQWEIPVRAILHDNPSTLYQIMLVMRDSSHGGEAQNLNRIGLHNQIDCPYNGVGDKECAFEWTLHVDTTKFSDGWKELTLVVEATTPDGKSFRTSSRIPVRFSNGNREVSEDTFDRTIDNSACRNTSFLARGWYDGIGSYADARVMCLPMKAASGTLDLLLSGGRGGNGKHLTVKISGNHAIPAVGLWPSQPARAGRIIFDKDGNFETPVHMKLDTRTLENGWHTIAVNSTHKETAISMCPYCENIRNSLSGVGVGWFKVSN